MTDPTLALRRYHLAFDVEVPRSSDVAQLTPAREKVELGFAAVEALGVLLGIRVTRFEVRYEGSYSAEVAPAS